MAFAESASLEEGVPLCHEFDDRCLKSFTAVDKPLKNIRHFKKLANDYNSCTKKVPVNLSRNRP
jgi:hypothetical protein